MNFFHAIILGIVEGVTEFLPISSTGHLILVSKVLRLASTDFLKSFEIGIQLGAILAVVVQYFRSFFVKFEILKKVIVAFLPTAILGLIFYKVIKQFLLGSEQVVLWALFLGGVFLIIFEIFYREKQGAAEEIEKISWRQAVVIGLFQSVAMIPGVSRAAATIIGGLILGLKRKTIVEFSFLLAVPTMAAATGLDLISSGGRFSSGEFWLLAVGFIFSFVTALFAIRFFLKFIKNHSFIIFGVYRIILAGAGLIFFSFLL
ncbi:undecaprenyl-diphosphate phosphatase [Candidatus Falkowbacteria bacterium]|nr:undecaprenyl-diphosphate phosphatase [Candidatus Falkowbacteria bacterium]